MIDEEASVEKETYVEESAETFGKAIIRGNAKVIGTSQVFDNAIVEENAIVIDSKIYNNAHIRGDVLVKDSIVFGEAFLCGDKNIIGQECYKKNLKWLIPPMEYNDSSWEEVYAKGFTEKVWSCAKDTATHLKILDKIKQHNSPHTILMVGAGSDLSLSAFLLEKLDVEIDCVDIPAVVSLMKDTPHHVKYCAMPLTCLKGLNRKYDIVIALNSILSSDDKENRATMTACRDRLKDNGLFIGVFPSLFCGLEISLLGDDKALREKIDLERSTVYDERQNQHQIFYTPLRLRRIFKEACMELSSMEIMFLDSPLMREESYKHYGIADGDTVVYELLACGQKKFSDKSGVI